MGASTSAYPKLFLKLLLLLCLVFSLFALLPNTEGVVFAAEAEPVSSFLDITTTDDDFRYIKFLHDKGIVAGFPDETFQPFQPLTRAEGAKMLALAADIPIATENIPVYKDVSSQHWAYSYIAAVTDAAYLQGYSDSTFRPEQELTRAEVALILFRAYGIDYPWTEQYLADDVPYWAADAVNMVIDTGLMGIDGDGHFLTYLPITRVEFVRALALLHTIHEDWRLTTLKATLWPQGGVVELHRPNQALISVSEPTTLDVGDLIITGAKTEAEIRFEDGSGLVIKAGSEIKIQKLIGSLFILPDGTGASAVEDLEVQFLKGTMFGALATIDQDTDTTAAQTGIKEWTGLPLLAFASDNWQMIGYNSDLMTPSRQITVATPIKEKLPPWKQLLQKKVRVKVNMPHGVAAVRGSFWKVQLEQIGDRIREIVNFIHGEGEVQNGDHVVALSAGQTTAIEAPDAPPSAPQPMTQAEKQEWATLKTWVADRIEQIKQTEVTRQIQKPSIGAAPQPTPSTPVQQISNILSELEQLLEQMETLEEASSTPSPSFDSSDGDDYDYDDYGDENDDGDEDGDNDEDENGDGDEDGDNDEDENGDGDGEDDDGGDENGDGDGEGDNDEDENGDGDEEGDEDEDENGDGDDEGDDDGDIGSGDDTGGTTPVPDPPVDRTPPAVSSFEESDVPVDSSIVVTFNEYIRLGSGSGNITLRLASGQGTGTPIPIDVSIQGNQLKIVLSDSQDIQDTLNYATEYILIIPAGAVTDRAGNSAGDMELRFTTMAELAEPDDTPLALESTNFIMEHEDDSIVQSIELTFNKEIQEVTEVSGIYLQRVSENSSGETVTISIQTLEDGKTLQITPDGLDYATEYTLVIPAGAILDESDNTLAAEIEISFTTAEPPGIPPAIRSGRIEVVSAYYWEIPIQFDRPVKINDGNYEDDFISLMIDGEDYRLRIGEEDEAGSFVALSVFPYDRGDVSSEYRQQIVLSPVPDADVTLEEDKDYYAALWKEGETDPIDTYNLTPLGFATFTVILEPDCNDIYMLDVILSHEVGGVNQFQSISLQEGQNTYSATIPLNPGMASGEWQLTDISILTNNECPDQSVYESVYSFRVEGKEGIVFDPVDSLGFKITNEVNQDITPVEINSIKHWLREDGESGPYALTTIIEADDPSGIEYLATIYASPWGNLGYNYYNYEEISPGVWQATTYFESEEEESEGEWRLLGLFTKDGANNWVIPDISDLPEILDWPWDQIPFSKSDGVNANYYEDIGVIEFEEGYLEEGFSG